MHKAFIPLLMLLSTRMSGQFYFLDDKHLETPFEFHVGLAGGMMNCFTDLGGGIKPGKVNWKFSRPVAGLFFSSAYKNRLTLRIDLNFGSVSGADSVLEPVKSNVHGRYERNLSFKSPINEVGLSLELYLLGTKGTQYLLQPYLLGGTGIFSFEPKTKLEGQWYALRPLHTEGQGFPAYPGRRNYKPTQLFFSAGGGLKYEASSLVYLQLEFNYRFLQTDYLEDVSTEYIDPALFDIYLPEKQAIIAKKLYKRKLTVGGDSPYSDTQRGNPARKDAYFSIMFKSGIRLARKRP